MAARTTEKERFLSKVQNTIDYCVRLLTSDTVNSEVARNILWRLRSLKRDIAGVEGSLISSEEKDDLVTIVSDMGNDVERKIQNNASERAQPCPEYNKVGCIFLTATKRIVQKKNHDIFWRNIMTIPFDDEEVMKGCEEKSLSEDEEGKKVCEEKSLSHDDEVKKICEEKSLSEDEEVKRGFAEKSLSFYETFNIIDGQRKEQVTVNCKSDSDNNLKSHQNCVCLRTISKIIVILFTFVSALVAFLAENLRKGLDHDTIYHSCRKLHDWSFNFDKHYLYKQYSKTDSLLDFIGKQFHRIPSLQFCVYPFFPSSIDLFQNGKRKPDLDTMQYEASRLASFASFPITTGVYATKLASAGFYYTGKADEVICFNCGLRHSQWKRNDSPIEIHKEGSPNCSFIKEKTADVSSTQNITQNGACGTSHDVIEPDNRIPLMKDHIHWASSETRNTFEHNVKDNGDKEHMSAISAAMEQSSSHQNNTPTLNRNEAYNGTEKLEILPNSQPARQQVLGNQQNLNTTNVPSMGTVSRANREQKDLLSIGISLNGSKYPQYVTKASRLDTFTLWPQHLTQTPEDMTMAGFFFTGIEDHCRCFFCGGGLKHWEPNDQPLEEHARWYPHCAYLQHVRENSSGLDKTNTNKQSKKNEPTKKPSKSPTSLDFKNHPAVATIAELGYDLNTIKKAFDHLQTNKSAVIDASVLLETLFNLEEELRQGPRETPKTEVTVQESIPRNNCPNQNNKHTALDPEFELSIRSLEEENQTLRDQQTCKICLDEPIAIVFLPCGHMASCKNCAPALRRCPICRAFIKGTVKAIMC